MNKNNDLKSKILLMRKKNFGENELLNKKDEKEKVSTNATSDHNKISSDESQQNNLVENKIRDVIEKKEPTSQANEKAFNLLANKFNESVEVILELNKRVEKLETLVRLQSMQDYKKETKVTKNNNGFKLFILLLIISGVSYFV